jgi:uncharacterized membrane-anchored protein YitT (DUF2179 family)
MTQTAKHPTYATTSRPHTVVEDVQALFTGILMAGLGVTILSKAGMVTGGLVGVALLLQRWTGISFGILFAAINLPFYILAWKKKGWRFTFKTLVSVLLLSVLCDLMPSLVALDAINLLFAGVSGGLLAGVGLLILFRHDASLGGFNILCLYIQETTGIPAGMMQLALDCVVLALFALVSSPATAALSLIAAVILNLTLANNHRPGRYLGKSAG